MLHFRGILVMIMATMLVVTMGCIELPDSSRTGQAHLVRISDAGILPANLMVRTGDEVLFSNPGPTQMWMYFATDRRNALSCRRGFSYFWGNEEAAAVPSNGSVSLCFSRPGIYGYWVQPLPTDRGGAPQGQISIQDAVPGAIVVITPFHSR